MTKRILVGVAVAALVSASCMAQPADVDVVHTPAQVIAWDPVIEGEDGSPILEGETVEYEVFYRHSVTGDEGSLGLVDVTRAEVDLSALVRGYYYVGVRSIIGDEQSVIVWSNDALAVLDQRFALFVVRPIVPERPAGIKVE